MNSLFTHMPIKRPKRKYFDLGHEKKMSFAPGKIIPILCTETVPGDTFRCNAEIALQFAPMIAPLMHRVDVVTRFFFVPNRLIWPDFNKEFISGGPEGTSTLQVPSMWLSEDVGDQASPGGTTFASQFKEGSLMDYFGLGTNMPTTAHIPINILPFRAYQLIYNEYFRNQNSEDEVDFGNGLNKIAGVVHPGTDQASNRVLTRELFKLRTMNWQHDYFTSTLPWTQRGNPVVVPITGEGTVQIPGIPVDIVDDGGPLYLERLDGGDVGREGVAVLGGVGVKRAAVAYTDGILPSTDYPLAYDGGLQATTRQTGNLDVALEGAGITIESLRRTARLQEWLEKNARAGARYIEQILQHFGVLSSDARLQRPEYLGGGRQIVKVSNILQTSGTTQDSPQANPSGYGAAYGMSNRFKYFCEEHGYIIGVMYVMPKTAYEQGIPRMFSHIDKFDYYFPEFAHLGEQDVKMKELYIDSSMTAEQMNATFGYLPRYAEYKSALSSIHGQMRSSLDFWHWGRKFANAPAWNDEFMKYNDDRRIFAFEDDSADPIWSHIYIDLKAKRPMPKFGVPYL